jgi:hypothetical protein
MEESEEKIDLDFSDVDDGTSASAGASAGPEPNINSEPNTYANAEADTNTYAEAFVNTNQETSPIDTVVDTIGDALTQVGEQVTDVVEAVVGTEAVDAATEQAATVVAAVANSAPIKELTRKTRKIKRPAANAPIVNLTLTATEPKKRLVKTMKKPKDKPRKATTAEEWIELKAKFPTLYDVDENGNFYASPLGEDGQREDTNIIRSTVYYKDTTDNIIGKYKARDTSDEAKALDEAYASAKVELRGLYKEFLMAKANPTAGLNVFNASLSGIIDANRRVKEAEQLRNAYYGFSVKTQWLDEKEKEYSLFFDAAFDKDKKYPNEVMMCRRNRFPWSYNYTDVKPLPPVEPVEVLTEESDEQAGGGSREYTDEQKRIIASKQIAAWRQRQRAF